MSGRVRWWAPALGLLVLAGTVASPLSQHARMQDRARRAAQALDAIHQLQTAFRLGGGSGGYATEIGSLTTPCPREPQAVASGLNPDAGSLSPPGYALELRAAVDGQTVGADCHGRPSVSNYYVSAAPRVNGVDGRQALAMTADGRIFVFFDGVPPRERDMTGGGLAVPLETLSTFKIP